MSILHRRGAVIARHVIAAAAGAALRNIPHECVRASEREVSAESVHLPEGAAPIPPAAAVRRAPAKRKGKGTRKR